LLGGTALRVLFVDGEHGSDPPLGRAAAFHRLALHLGQHLETRWVVGHHGQPGALSLPPGSMTVDMRGRGLRSSLWLWRAVREASAEFRPDVLLVRGLEVPPLGVPAISVVRDLVSTGWEPDPVGRLGRWIAPWLRHLVVPTNVTRQELLSLGVSAWRIERIGEVVDLPAVPAPLPRPSGTLRLVHPGSIHPAKGQHHSVDAVQRLPRALRDRVELRVVGPVRDVRYASQLRTASAGLPISFEGAEHLPERVRGADLVLYPTTVNEGFADAAVQAMAEGRPVVYSDLPGLREVLGEAGLPVPPSDVAALRHTIVCALDGLLDTVALGAAGRRWVEESFSWGALWPRWRMLLGRVAR
jgi:glycosyltransferase involved in cell wall biosynthesis